MNASQAVLYVQYQCICAQRKHYSHLSMWVADTDVLGLKFVSSFSCISVRAPEGLKVFWLSLYGKQNQICLTGSSSHL